MILLRLALPMVMFLIVSCKPQKAMLDEEKISHSKEIDNGDETCDVACVRAPCNCDEDRPKEDSDPYCFPERKRFVRIFDDGPRCKDGKYIGPLPTIDPSCSESIVFEPNCQSRTSIGDVISVGEYSIVDTELNVDDEHYPRIFTIIDEKTIENSEDGKLWKISK